MGIGSRSTIVLSIDGINASFLGPYGATWLATPGWNRLAAAGVTFETALTPSLDPVDAWSRVWGAGADVGETFRLCDVLARAGVRTTFIGDDAALVAAARSAGFDRVVPLEVGVERRRSNDDLGAPPFDPRSEASAASLESTVAFETMEATLALLAEGAEPGLCWIHWSGAGREWDAPVEWRAELMDEEGPDAVTWTRPPGVAGPHDFSDDERLQWQVAYAAQIQVLDACLDTFREALAALEPWADASLIVTAPRGYAVAEHGRANVYEDARADVAEVPLIVVGEPGWQAIRDSRLVCLVDLASSIISGLGLDVPHEAVGRVILPDAGAESWNGRSYLHLSGLGYALFRTRQWALQDWDRDRTRLYLKPEDRFEVHDVADRLVDTVAQLSNLAQRTSADPFGMEEAGRHAIPEAP